MPTAVPDVCGDVDGIACVRSGIDDERMASLRKRCLKDVKNTIGNIRFDKIYNTEHNRFHAEEGFDETEY